MPRQLRQSHVTTPITSRDENVGMKTVPRPVLFRFLFFFRPFSYLQKNMEIGRKRLRVFPARFCISRF